MASLARLRNAMVNMMRRQPELLLRARQLGKALRLIKHRRFRNGLRHGVAATIEHNRIGFPRNVRTVIDVGANRGQFTLFALETFSAARVMAFEPLASSVEVLRAVTASEKDRVSIFATAVGAESGTVAFHVSAREDSSSVLEIGESQTARFPGTGLKAVVAVPMETLDCALPAEHLVRPCLLKIDVQGYEFEVLQGARKTLAEIDEVFVETSFVELYVGQHLAPDVIRFLIDAGFCPVGIHNAVVDPEGVSVQADVRFVRFSAMGHHCDSSRPSE